MKSVGEVMAIGRTQQESMQKALRGLEVGATGFDPKVDLDATVLSEAEDARSKDKIISELKTPGAERIWYVGDAFRAGLSVDEIYQHSAVSIHGSWFRLKTS